MQLKITGHHIEITDALRDIITAKCSKLDQYFDRINLIQVILRVEKVQQIAEATIHINGGELHASSEHEDMYAAIDGLVDKLARQLTKHKDKLRQH
ncbi:MULTISPECIES: ribosome hibernation promoting factor [Photorhabdus]|uniref:Ribosome hibernation promoting factor n=4 Tax=Photorhabdus TaxID=29487 RepID=A0A4R4JDD8_9GAMM|nr:MULTISPECIES: ribosome hibernation promoting factor [Photorhabdus]OHV55891.1 ribosomal subunit interface protein [Photorhabdus temperata]ETS32899.1 SSU ribosomal protein S30P/sigma 54 modulation protein [Photorhabdus khanii NC19]MQL48190.1 ribosome hibernation promoting factor [Photorhabdus khanii]NHB96229.1 ribosome hibernation promoting factor [Photorhabdus stackebrandtii]TDB52097.1 ribosome hibernation promoting factor [Photorhabdus khanii subsp. guanajuatensis]